MLFCWLDFIITYFIRLPNEKSWLIVIELNEFFVGQDDVFYSSADEIFSFFNK